MKRTALLVVVLLASSAHASFEMMLITDTVKGVIHRVDPQTDAYLGSFGSGWVGSQSFALGVDQGAGEVYFSNSAMNRVIVFDYNSGTYKRSWSLGLTTFARDIKITGSRVYVGGGARVEAYTKAGALIGAATAGITDVWGVAESLNGEIVALSRGTSTRAYMFNGNTFAPTFTSGSLSGNPYSLIYDQGTNNAYYSASTGAGDIIYSMNLFSAGPNVALTPGGARFELAAGHGDIRYATKANGVTTYIRGATAISPWTEVRTATWSQISDAGAIGVVVAPEPASLIAIGLGLAAVARRRRRG